MLMELVVYDTPADTAAGAARRIAELIDHAVDGFTLGLAGGTTPAAAYESLRDLKVRWETVDAWLSDERWVPLDDERSNGRMAAEALMNHVDARFHRPMWTEEMEASDSATRYEATLRSLHDGRRPDLILLGMGEDAHTASLFPGSDALDETERWFVANTIPETGEQRLTATFSLLWWARRLMVITTGQQKAAPLRDAFEGRSTPIGLCSEGDADVEWHVDSSAASLLS